MKISKKNLESFNDSNQISIFKEIRVKLSAISDEIILTSNNKMQQIAEETNRSLYLINKMTQKLHEKLLEKSLNNKFFEEVMTLFVNDFDIKLYRTFICNKNINLIENVHMKKIETIRYSNGDEYIGEYSNGKREGKGIMKFLGEGKDKGNAYEGE